MTIDYLDYANNEKKNMMEKCNSKIQNVMQQKSILNPQRNTTKL